MNERNATQLNTQAYLVYAYTDLNSSDGAWVNPHTP